MTRGPYKNIYHFYSNVYGANGAYTDRKAILNILFWFYITNYIQGQLLKDYCQKNNIVWISIFVSFKLPWNANFNDYECIIQINGVQSITNEIGKSSVLVCLFRITASQRTRAHQLS